MGALVRAVLGRYPFRDVEAAYANLVALSQEVPFLSPRRCRHFLASIAPELLRAVAETPDPDMALLNLEKVTASLGAKTVLWELFSFNPPSLRLYVDLCASSQFLSEILINNPPVRKLILEGREGELLELLKRSHEEGMIDFTSSLVELVESEWIHHKVALEATPRPEELKMRLKGLGLPLIDHGSHIVPVHVGHPVKCKMLSDLLLDRHGIYVQPINYPTVPRGTERLRFTPSPVHGPREMEALVRAMDDLWSHCALNRAELSA